MSLVPWSSVVWIEWIVPIERHILLMYCFGSWQFLLVLPFGEYGFVHPKSTCCFSFIDLTISLPPLNFCWVWLSRNLRLLWYSWALVVTGPMSNMASFSFVLSLKGLFCWIVHPGCSNWMISRIPFRHGFHHGLFQSSLYQMILFPSWWCMTRFWFSLSRFLECQEMVIFFSLCRIYMPSGNIDLVLLDMAAQQKDPVQQVPIRLMLF